MKEALDPRSFTIATFALCGFANLSSIGIQIGGIGALAPNRKSDLARLGIRAMLSGTMANLMSASIVGMFCDDRAWQKFGGDTGAFARSERAAKFILAKTKLRPRVAIVLGCGLGRVCRRDCQTRRIPYAKIPHFPRSTAIGHAGQLVIGKAGNIPVAAMQGRVAFLRGLSAVQVVFPMRVLGRMGIRAAILTNAAGGINPQLLSGRAGGL